MDKFEIRNSKFEGVWARDARLFLEASIQTSGFEFRISNFEFSL